MQPLYLLLFPGFETLDACGPAEMFGQLQEHYTLHCISARGGGVESQQGLVFETQPWEKIAHGPLLIPGGYGTRPLVEDAAYLAKLRQLAEAAPYVLTVCTGSALLARTGLLDGRQATSNKLSFDWVLSQGPQVRWQKKARWVKDGKYYTSSGVSAGMDMALGFIAEHFGIAKAEEIARFTEYVWNRDPAQDPFALG